LFKTLSITEEVMPIPFYIYSKWPFNSSTVVVSSTLIFLICSDANSRLSLTSRSSLANLVIANSLVCSISFKYLLIVLSFSAS
jgi:hypothetical protein